MASQIEIANWALMLVSEKRISALSDDNANAEYISAAWDMLRDRALRRQAWHFAIERAELAADATSPTWGYDYQYSFNSDVVKLIQVGETYPGADRSDLRNSELAEYRVEGRKILTNYGAPLKVRWVVNSTAIGEWDPAFAALMAADIAEHIAPRATESDSISQRIANWRAEAMLEAYATNAIEDPPEHQADDSWMSAHGA
jgi:hypothetical protein